MKKSMEKKRMNEKKWKKKIQETVVKEEEKQRVTKIDFFSY